MNTAVKLAGFGIGLAAVFTAALGLGRIAGHTPASAPAAHGHAAATAAHGHDGTAAEPVAALPGGLQVTQDGYRLTPLTTVLSTGVPRQFRFQIIGPDGRPVIGYTTSHDRDLHLIVVRRDLSGFQHVHPRLADDGTWSIPVAVPTAGQYRVFADFQPIGHDGITLGADVPAAGDYRPVPLPAAARTATVDGYTVTLAGDLAPGRPPGHRPAAVPGRLRAPGRAARRRPGLPARAPGRRAGRRTHRGRSGGRLPRRGPVRRHVPAVPGLPAQRDGAHRGVHRRGRSARQRTVESGRAWRRRP